MYPGTIADCPRALPARIVQQIFEEREIPRIKQVELAFGGGRERYMQRALCAVQMRKLNAHAKFVSKRSRKRIAVFQDAGMENVPPAKSVNVRPWSDAKIGRRDIAIGMPVVQQKIDITFKIALCRNLRERAGNQGAPEAAFASGSGARSNIPIGSGRTDCAAS